MFGISGEHLLVLLVILLIFGPKRLPDLGHSIGRTLKNFKDGLNTPLDTAPSTAAPANQRIAKAETATAEKLNSAFQQTGEAPSAAAAGASAVTPATEAPKA